MSSAKKKRIKKGSAPGIWIALLLGFVLYTRVINAPFVFDDVIFIQQNTALHDPSNPATVWRFSPARFLVNYSFAVNYGFHGESTAGYRLFNIICHLTATFLVWLLIRRFLVLAKGPSFLSENRESVALFGALLFTAHPIQTQSVSYIWQRSTLMAACFYLAGLYFYLEWREWVSQGKPSNSRLTGSLLCGLAAMFCKEIAFTFPIAVAMIEIFLFNETRRPGWLYFLPYGILLLVVPATVLFSMDRYDAMLGVAPETGNIIPPLTYLLTQLRVTVFYLRLLLLPVSQNIDHDPTLAHGLFEPVTLLSFLLLLSIVMAGMMLFARFRLLALGIFWFFLTLSVEAAAFTLPDVMFEHRLYLPMFGVSLFLAVGVARLTAKYSIRLFYPATGLVVLLSIATFNRNLDWRSPLRLWDGAVSLSPDKARPYLNRAIALRDLGRGPEALRDFDKALSLEPNNTLALMIRGLFHQHLKNYELALADYDRALTIGTGKAVLWQNRGAIYLEKGLFQKAIADFDQAIKIDAHYAIAFKNRGFAYQSLDHHKKAIKDFDKAIALDPEFAEALFSRAVSRERLGQNQQARTDYEAALKLNDNLKNAHLNLGVILYNEGADGRAKRHFETALRIDPNFIEVYMNQGTIAFQEGDYISAVATFSEAIDLKPGGDLYYRRGVSYLKLGEIDRASSDLDKAGRLGYPVPDNVLDLIRGRGAEQE